MERNEKRSSVKTENGSLNREPSRLIEPESSIVKTSGDVIDWAPWERDYREKLGIELTEADKNEIKATVPAFFRLLREIEAQGNENGRSKKT